MMCDPELRNQMQRPAMPPSYGNRPDGTKKGNGWLGPIKSDDGSSVSTEITVGVNWGEGEKNIPLMVPTLTKEEVRHIVNGGEPTKEIIGKAVEHAKKRIGHGESPYAD